MSWKRPYVLPLWVATAGLALIAGALLRTRFAAGPYLLFYLMIPPAEILLQGQMQRQFDSAGRATLSSVVSFIFTGLAIVAGLALGWVAERQGIRGLFALAGGLVFLAGSGSVMPARNMLPIVLNLRPFQLGGFRFCMCKELHVLKNRPAINCTSG